MADKRAQPDDDLLSELVAVSEGDDRLSEAELLSMTFLLIMAGYETTVNLIGNSAFALLRDREKLWKAKSHSAACWTAFRTWPWTPHLASC